MGKALSQVKKLSDLKSFSDLSNNLRLKKKKKEKEKAMNKLVATSSFQQPNFNSIVIKGHRS